MKNQIRIVLDGRALLEKAAGHEYLAERFAFPEYYGKNLDALWDLLSERDNLDIYLTYSHQVDKGEFEGLIELFEDYANEHERASFHRFPGEPPKAEEELSLLRLI